MAGSTLDPENIPGRPQRKTQKGHDLKSLGPSDTSDSGSDMAGPGQVDDDVLPLDRGTNEDPEGGTVGKIEAGASVGDREMDDTSDASGTGEHLTAGKEPRLHTDQDRDTDRIVGPAEAGLGGGLDQAEEAQLGTTDEELERSDRGPKRKK
jgi:hypothetical protein